VLVLLALLSAGCPGSDGREPLPLDLPSRSECVFAEKRDFVVVGYFPTRLGRPGDVRIELFAGSDTRRRPVRSIRSHVDPSTGLTPRESLDFGYERGQAWGPQGGGLEVSEMLMTPDLVAVPGGIENPTNKVVVTPEYYAGVVLGGASRDFDTRYAGDDGVPWTDLNAGQYTIRVTGISGDFEGRSNSRRIEFGRTHAMLGRFSPGISRDKMLVYAAEHGFRTYIDFFPGFFSQGGYSYEIPGRWMANNAVEVVNTFPDSLRDTLADAQNDLLLYNISGTSATQRIEIGGLVSSGLLTQQTTFHYYDIGEPFIPYLDASTGMPASLSGTITAFEPGDRLALTRIEIEPAGESGEDNLYDFGAVRQRGIDTDLDDGVALDPSREFSIYGVTAPLPSATRPGPLPHQFEVANSIRSIEYRIRSEDGSLVLADSRPVGLKRLFEPVHAQSRSMLSIYEFKHRFRLDESGTYTVSAHARDAEGAEVPGGAATFQITVGRR